MRLLTLLIVMAAGAISHAAEAITKEYQLKAAFLYNFAKFVEWPAAAFTGATSPLVIGVLGRNPFGDELSNAVKDRRINGRPIEIKQVSSAADARVTHILFVSAGQEKSFGAIKHSLGVGVLSVGESAQFASQSGIINFNLEGDKLRFEINMATAVRSGLKISAQLQKLATSIQR